MKWRDRDIVDVALTICFRARRTRQRNKGRRARHGWRQDGRGSDVGAAGEGVDSRTRIWVVRVFVDVPYGLDTVRRIQPKVGTILVDGRVQEEEILECDVLSNRYALTEISILDGTIRNRTMSVYVPHAVRT